MNKQRLKEEALKIRTKKEYNNKIGKLYKKGLIMDNDILKHFDNILGEAFNPLEDDIITETFKRKKNK